MGIPIDLATTLSAHESTALLWACIALLVALCLILVILSIITGGKRRRLSGQPGTHTPSKRKG
jgi:hypothetical protein